MHKFKAKFKGGRSASPPLDGQVQNPAYDPKDWDIENEDSEYDDENDFDLTIDRMKYQLDDMTRLEESNRLQISSLKKGKDVGDTSLAKWRKGPAPAEEKTEAIGLKLASLQGTIGDGLKSEEMFVRIFELSGWEASSDDSIANATASSTLINYFAYLGSTDELGEVDYDFLDMLIKVADINAVDKYGQSIMHEVAREWNTDLARYIKLHRGRIDIPDNYGRTPLFVAVSSNHTTIVRWLIDHGANINHKTMEGEGQKPIHFAAKHAAVEAFDLLVQYGASPVEKDDKDRTPFYLAAERGQHSMCEHLLQLNLPVASYSSTGVSTIDHVISKLPSKLAHTALDQFISEDVQNFKDKYYLSCLGKRRWKTLTNFRHISPTGDPSTPLEIIVERNDLELIMHPVILKYLEVMSLQFGAKYTSINILLCVLFTIIWTIAITLYNKNISFNISKSRSVDATIAMTVFGQLLSIYFIYKFAKEYLQSKLHCKNEQTRLLNEISSNSAFSHPRWTGEESLLNKQRKVAGRKSVNFWADGWNYIEGLCLLMSCLQTLLVILLAVKPTNETIQNVLLYYSCAFVLVVWLRLNRCLRSHQTFGPFITILAECVTAVTRFAFLFMEFYIPFTCAFWVIFGGNRKGQQTEYTEFNDLVYQLFLMAMVGDYDYDTLRDQDKIAAQILIFLYFILISIISLNLFIALLSEAFERVRQKADAGTYLQQAKDYIDIARHNPMLYRDFEIFLNENASPMLLDRTYKRSTKIESSKQHIEEISKKMQSLIAQMEHIQTNHHKIVHNLEVGESKFQMFQGKYSFDKLTAMAQTLTLISQTPMYDLDKPIFERLVEKFQEIRVKNFKMHDGVDRDFQFEEFEFKPLE